MLKQKAERFTVLEWLCAGFVVGVILLAALIVAALGGAHAQP